MCWKPADNAISLYVAHVGYYKDTYFNWDNLFAIMASTFSD